VNATLICPELTVATSEVGALGITTGVALTLLDTVPSPLLLTARSRIVYDVPFVSPVMDIGELVCDTVTYDPPLREYL
jgi:hypothetical protein